MATFLKVSGNVFNNSNKTNIESVITFLIHKETLHSETVSRNFSNPASYVFARVIQKLISCTCFALPYFKISSKFITT